MGIPTIQHIQNVTAFKTEARARAALKTLAWLADGAPGHHHEIRSHLTFDMTAVIDPILDCGTACCIGGAILIFENGNTQYRNLAHNFVDGDIQWRKAHDLYHLFFQYGERDRSPAEAYKVFLHYLNTGIGDWSIANNK